MRSFRLVRPAFALAFVPLAATAAPSMPSGSGGSGPCQPEWLPTFGEAPGVVSVVYALEALDVGFAGGSALYVGGLFGAAGGTGAQSVAR